jgi:hypothetical protein
MILMTKYRNTIFVVSAMGGAVLFVLFASGCIDLKPVQAQLDDLKARISQMPPKVITAYSEGKDGRGNGALGRDRRSTGPEYRG